MNSSVSVRSLQEMNKVYNCDCLFPDYSTVYSDVLYEMSTPDV
jgi:hypothetical protein